MSTVIQTKGDYRISQHNHFNFKTGKTSQDYTIERKETKKNIIRRWFRKDIVKESMEWSDLWSFRRGVERFKSKKIAEKYIDFLIKETPSVTIKK